MDKQGCPCVDFNDYREAPPVVGDYEQKDARVYWRIVILFAKIISMDISVQEESQNETKRFSG